MLQFKAQLAFFNELESSFVSKLDVDLNAIAIKC